MTGSPEDRPVTSPFVERFVHGELSATLTEAEHLARYGLAARLARGKVVLDAGCGSGVGTVQLAANGAREVIGVDIDRETIEVGRRTILHPNIQLVIGDVTDLQLPSDFFDLVVCFEVLEHVQHPDVVVDELLRVLQPDGTLVISSPNPRGYQTGNPFHIHEFLPEELAALVGDRIRNVCVWRQDVALASIIASTNSLPEQASLTISAVHLGKEATYSVVLASNSPLPRETPEVRLGPAWETRWWDDQLKAARAESNALAEALRVAEQRVVALKRCETLSSTLQQEVWNLRQTLNQKAAELDELNARVAQHGDRLLTAQTELATSIQERWELRETINDLERQHRELGNELEISQTERLGLQEWLDTVHRSSSWRITAPLRKLRKLLSSHRR